MESLIIAFLCTMLLIYFSRRATLRQMNASLAVISQQLKAQQHDNPTNDPTA